MTVEIKDDGKGKIFVEQIGKGIKPAVPRAVALYGGRLIRRIRMQARRSFKNPSGKLGKSFSMRVTKGTPVRLAIKSSAKHAGIQDRGGTITAKGRALAIPLTPRARVTKPRAMPGLFILNKGGDRGLLVQKIGRRVQPQYALRKSVRIKGTGYLQKALRASIPDARKTFKDMAVKVVRSAKRKAGA